MNALIDSRNVHTVKRDFAGIAAFIACIWIVFALDLILPIEQLGLVPRSVRGLTGIVAMPFIHGDLAHLIGNSIPLGVTLILLAGSRANSGVIVILIAFLCGVGLWIFGREALHIGASGVVFGLISFHLFAGIFERRMRSLVISLLVGFLYASTVIQGVMPFQPGVSWEGHLIGAISGALVALLIARKLKNQTGVS